MKRAHASFAANAAGEARKRAAVDRFADALAETGEVMAACYRARIAYDTGVKYLGQIRRTLGPQAV